MTKDEIKLVATHILSHTSKMMEYMKFYNECADTDCKQCEMKELCADVIILQNDAIDTLEKLEEKQ